MLKKISHIVLVPLLLVATVGMTVNLHFCQQELYDIGILTQAENCCISGHEHLNADMPDKKHHDHQCDSSNHKSNDCEDETIHVDAVDSFVFSTFDYDFNNSFTTQLFNYSLILSDLLLVSTATKVEYPLLHTPPPNIHVVLSLLQTYLI